MLLVDANEPTNFLNRRLWLRLGVAGQVAMAPNGAQALAYLASPNEEIQNQRPALILVELYLSVRDGLAFLKAY